MAKAVSKPVQWMIGGPLHARELPETLHGSQHVLVRDQKTGVYESYGHRTAVAVIRGPQHVFPYYGYSGLEPQDLLKLLKLVCPESWEIARV